MHASGRRKIPRAHRGVQRALAIRRPRLWPHRNRHQQVCTPLPLLPSERPGPTTRSEVVGRPLAALLANDGARVFSVDIGSIQEYTKRPTPPNSDEEGGKAAAAAAAERRAYHPRHVVRSVPPSFDLSRCLALSDVVISAVPSATYKVPTAALKDGCVCVNVAADKNFEADVRDKVRFDRHFSRLYAFILCVLSAGVPVYPGRGKGNDFDAAAKSVSRSHLAITTLGSYLSDSKIAFAAVPGPALRDILVQDCEDRIEKLVLERKRVVERKEA